MSARDCINKKAAAGIVNQDQAKAASDLYDEQLARLKRLNAPNAEAAAEQATLAGLKRANLAKKKATIATLKAQEGFRARIQGQREQAPAAALALLDFDPTFRQTGPNVVQTGHDIERQTLARMNDPIMRFRARFANVDRLPTAAQEARRATMRDIAREMHGEASGSQEAAVLSKGFRDAFEYQRQLANASGFSIPKMENYFPHVWNRRLLAAIDEPGLKALSPAARRARKGEIFTDDMVPRLKRDAMLDFDTGLPMSEPSLRKLLTDSYEEVVTGGLSNLKPGMAIGSNLATRRMQSRVLIFKDADAWLGAHEKWSGENLFDVAIHHIRAMSRDIALMRLLGPNPEASARYIEKMIASEIGQSALEGVGAKAARAAANRFGGASRFRRNFDLVTGRLDQPDNSMLAAIDESNRNVVYASTMGGAIFSALTDRGFSFATESLLGVPHGRTMMRFLKLLNPLSEEDRALALRVGFGAEDMIGSMTAATRYTGEILNPSVTRTMADSVIRSSGLVRWTTAGRQAFRLEFLGELTRLRNTPFDALPEANRRAFGLFDINKADWNEFRAIQPWRDDKTGAAFLRPHDLVGGDPGQLQAGPLFDRRFELSQKFYDMVNVGAEFAVPSVSSRARADTLMGTHPGSGGGIFMRNIMTLKSFSLSLIYLHMNMVLNSRLSGLTKAKFVAQTIIGTTILAALGEQLHQIAFGKDPLNMDASTPEGLRFWKKVGARSGGLGLFGDFIFSDLNRYGGSLAETAAGPVGLEIDKGIGLTFGNVQELIGDGETKNAGRELEQFARLMQPGRSLWYTTLAMDRMVWDEVQMQLDPNYSDSFSRAEDRALNETGQEFFSPPGSGFPPPRGPNLGASVRGP